MHDQEEGMPQTIKVVERNINALLERRKADQLKTALHYKIVKVITDFVGSMSSVYIHLMFFGGWIIWNIGWLQLKPFDPSFIIMATFAAVEAIFLSIFILISQNMMSVDQDKRAELNLQVSLLTEHEVTRMITMLSAIAEKLELGHIINDEIKEFSKDIHPEKMMDTLETAVEKSLPQP